MGKKIKGTVELVFSEDDIKAELIFSPGDQETDLITPEEINKVFAEKKLLPLSLDNINTALSKVSHLTEKGAVFLAEGFEPEQPKPETVDWGDLNIPSDILPYVNEKIHEAGNAVISYTETKKIKKEVPEKSGGIFKKKETVNEYDVVTREVSVEVDQRIYKKAYFFKNTEVGIFVPYKPGKPGKNLAGKTIPPKQIENTKFYLGTGLERTGNKVICKKTGIMRCGSNWAEVIPFSKPYFQIKINSSDNSLDLEYDRGNSVFPEIQDIVIYEKAKEMLKPGMELVPMETLSIFLEDAGKKPGIEHFLCLTKANEGNIKITYNSDKTEAYLTIRKAVGGENRITLKEIAEAINREKLVNIDREKIKTDILTFYNGKDLILENYLLCKGIPPSRGERRVPDFQIEWLDKEEEERVREKLKEEEVRSALSGDEEFNLDSIKYMSYVTQEEILAVWKERDAGTSGRDVFGNVLEGIPGNDLIFETDSSLDISEDGIKATKSGLFIADLTDEKFFGRVLNFQNCFIGIEISADKMTVNGVLKKSQGPGIPLTKEEVIKRLNDKKVIFGIKEAVIEKAVNGANERGLPVSLVLAAGKHSVAPGSLVIDWKVTPKGQKASGLIKAGGIIAVVKKLAENESIQGKDVFGNELKNDKAESIFQIDYDDSVFREESSVDGVFILKAKKNGEIIYTNGKIFIRNEKIITGDVDEKTGHIKFIGSLKVCGSVRPGMIVFAGGNIAVKGNVESCLISTEKSIYVLGNVIGGGKGVLRANENIQVENADQASLFAGSDIIVKGKCTRCNVKTNGRLIVGIDQGIFSGGMVRASKGGKFFDLGSPKKTATEIHFGQNYLIQDKIEVTEKELEKLKFQLVNINNKLDVLKNGEFSEEEINDLRSSKVRTMKEIENKSLALFTLREKYEQHVISSVIVKNTVFPGVVIESHNRIYEVKEEKNCGQFLFDMSTGHIVWEPL